jgi:FlaA1/EpsC-like NDP-sugar epimerase
MRGDFLLIVLDLAIVVAVYLLLFAARFDFSVPSHYWDNLRIFLPVACLVSVGSNAVFGCYGRTWRHASIDEAIRLIAAGAVSGVILLLAFIWGAERIPLTVLLAGPVVVTALFGLLRFQSRVFAFKRNAYKSGGVRIAVVGAGTAAAAALREMQQSPMLGLVPVLVVDDDPSLRWRSIHGVPIVGGIQDLTWAIHEHAINQILLAIPSADADMVGRVADIAETAGLPVRVLRASSSWAHGMPRLRDMRDLDIEDLLGRQQVQIDLEPVRQLLQGRRVLVTGGGGWIGSEIARQVAEFAPASLVLLDHDETHLHDAQHTLSAHAEIALGDIRDATVVDTIFDAARPEIVFHAAAHKHVPILESFACEAVRTNVFGTLNVVEASKRVGATHLVCISTDKAATPTAVMGASKWLAEQIVLARAPGENYCSVRFGNVLGSRGSVIPTFERQIAAGGPVTVTDARMTRYFMSTDEAVRLVLHAAATSSGPQVLALEMGEQVNIYSLAERMIRLCGLQPHHDIQIEITGLRPGERLSEVVVGPTEQRDEQGQAFVGIAPVRLDEAAVVAGLEQLERQTVADDHAGVRATLLALAGTALVEKAPPAPAPRSVPSHP